MKAMLSQLRRIYADDGRGDTDFSYQEERLRQSQQKLREATQALVRSSVYLNDVLLANGFSLDKNNIN